MAFLIDSYNISACKSRASVRVDDWNSICTIKPQKAINRGKRNETHDTISNHIPDAWSSGLSDQL